MIGYYDPYLFESSPVKLNLPNVDILKLAAYYKEKNEYGRLILPGECAVAHYDKIYCYSEMPCTIPDVLKRSSNVIYGGSFFTNGKYIPFEDTRINYTAPANIEIYYDFLKTCPQNPKQLNEFLDNAYYRIGMETPHYTPPLVHKGHKVYIYDMNLLEVPDWQQRIKELCTSSPSTIACVHPITCTKLSQFFQLRNINRISRGENNIVLNLAIPGQDIGYLFKQYLHLFQAEITTSSNVYLQLGGNLQSISEYYRNLIYVLNLLYCFWSKQIMMKVWYKAPAAGYITPVDNLSRMIANWANLSTPNKRYHCLNNSFRKNGGDEASRDELNQLLRNFPNAANLFNQSYELLQIRKYWGF